jgi:uncharacterized protein
MNSIIVYHAHCIDGLAAAAVVYDFAIRHNLKFDYVPMKAGETPAKVLSRVDSNILFLDVAPKLIEYNHLIANGNRVMIQDHHITAKEDLESVIDNNDVVFNIEMSGATLAALHYATQEPFMKVLLHIEDKDLNKMKYGKDSEYIFYALCDQMNKIEDSNEKIPLMLANLDKFDELVAKGKSLEAENDEYIDDCINMGMKKEFGFISAWVMFTESVKLCGEIGNRVLDESSAITFTMVIYPKTEKDGYNVSLRSRPDFKVSSIAKLFGGGGHDRAAGFRVDKVSDIFNTLYEKGLPKD